MARAIWSGSISFGLLNVPVRLYSAVARRNIALREIRESDSARIKHRRVAEGTDEEVPYENIVKAYEITPGQYVPLSKDEMSALAPEKTRAIEVQDFVDLEEIDPIYFDSPYYLGPADGAEKAYALLAKAMESSGKVAISRFVFRNKEHLAALRSTGGILTLTTMRFADEVVPAAELGDDVVPEKTPKVNKREQEMAEQLIESLSTEFDPSAYRDEYREQLLALIERKAEGKEIVAPEAEEPKATKAPDLMAALEESIAAVKDKGGAKAKPKAAGKAKSSGKKPSGSKAKKGSSSRAKSSRSKAKAAK
ncbi:MAG TPA: Ku protein [Solirubrobacterales bacterium]|nr:Ku protein [Solirubrobacterales bacterium]